MAVAPPDAQPAPPKRRRRRSSVSSAGSRSSSSSRGPRPQIVVSQKRRLLILALRYVISQKEYARVRKACLLHAPPAVVKNTPTRGEFDAVVKAARWDDYLPASSRAGVRMFLLCNVLLSGGGYAQARLRAWRSGARYVTPPPPPACRC